MTLDRRCVVCGSTRPPLQWHHLAGRAYAMRLGGWACRRCHTYLHGRLAAGGIDLRHPTLLPVVRAWAVTRGTSETIAAALVVLDQPEAADALRASRSRGRTAPGRIPSRSARRSLHDRWWVVAAQRPIAGHAGATDRQRHAGP